MPVNGSYNVTLKVLDAAPVATKVIEVRHGATHLEPVLLTDGFLGLYTSAWFHVYLNGDKGKYYHMIYQEMCQQPNMAECKIYE